MFSKHNKYNYFNCGYQNEINDKHVDWKSTLHENRIYKGMSLHDQLFWNEKWSLLSNKYVLLLNKYFI